MQAKVLSVKNPFAYLILQGGKDVENRTWTSTIENSLTSSATKVPNWSCISLAFLSSAISFLSLLFSL